MTVVLAVALPANDHRRGPLLAAPLRREGNVTSAADDSTSSWTVLGPKWWYMFIDGWAHAKGKNVFQGTAESQENGQTGNTLGLLQTQYESLASRIGHKWTPARVADLNIHLRDDGFICYRPHCLDAYSRFVPRRNAASQLHYNGGPLKDMPQWNVIKETAHTESSKRMLLESVLSSYYSELGDA